MHKDLRELAMQLSEIVQDYAVAPVTCDHVVEWIEQFDREERVPILDELVHILRKTYISRKHAENSLSAFLNEVITRSCGGDPHRFAAETSFLAIQDTGESQCDLLELTDKILQAGYNLSINKCSQSNARRFIYLDDGIFTGNKLRYDLATPPYEETAGKRGWLSSQAPHGSILHIFVLIAHSAGLEYARAHITKTAKERDVKVFFHHCLLVNNVRRHGQEQYECLWPSSDYGSQELAAYIDKLNAEMKQLGLDFCVLRPPGIPKQERFFSSSEARERLEKAFVLRGLELMKGTSIPSLRPLGFEKLRSLGLGTLAIPYRNCPNNAPLVLWWNSGGWKPLFRRRDNPKEQRRSVEGAEDDWGFIPF